MGEVRPPAPLREIQGAVVPQSEARVFDVDSPLVADTSDGCRYRATVRGLVREVPASPGASEAPEPARYVPALIADAAVRCPGGQVSHAPPRRLPEQAMTATQLASALQDSAVVLVPRQGRVCSVQLAVTFFRGRVFAPNLVESCSFARGGGPRTPRR